MLDVFVFVDLSFVLSLVKVWRVVIFVPDADSNVLGHCRTMTKGEKIEREKIERERK